MKILQTENLIKRARSLSQNEDFDEDYGIDDEPFIIALNDAQLEVHTMIVDEDISAFVAWEEIPTVANQETYDVPEDALVENLVYSVEFSPSGNERDYYSLEDGSYRKPNLKGHPQEYLIDGGKIYIWPIWSGSLGKLRVKFEKILDTLDKRRGKVFSLTTDSDPLKPLTIVLEEGADDQALENAEVICINSRTGVVKMRNIPVASYDAEDREITVSAGFTADSNSSAIAPGDYVTIGEDTTTHCKLKNICAPYLYNAAAYDAFRFKSSTDSEEQDGKLRRLMNAIVRVYSRLPGGKTAVPETRERY